MPRNFIRHKPFKKYINSHFHEQFPFHKPEIKGTGPIAALRSGTIPDVPYSLCLGQILPFNRKDDDIVKVQIHKLCLNKFLLKYFYQKATFWADGNGLNFNSGDIVLLEKLDKPIVFNTVLRVRKIVYPVGNVVDPATGLACNGNKYPKESLTKLVESLNLKSKTLE